MNLSASKKFELTRRSNNSQRKQTEQHQLGTSRYASPDSKSTSSQLSRSQTFQVSIQNLMPIITKIKQQNQFFADEKNRMDVQLKQLSQLSEMLMKQNEALRQHYYQRSIDLQQIISSININTKQDISDYEHIIHYYRQHNSLYNKKIEEIDQERKQVSGSINQLYHRLNQLNMKNVQLEKAISCRQVKNQQTLKALNKQKQLPLNLGNLEDLQKQVCDLCLEVGFMKRRNLQILRQAHEKRSDVDMSKPMMKHQTIQAIKSAKGLKEEILQLNTDFEGEKRNFNNLTEVNGKILQKIRDIQSQNEGKRLKISRISDRIRKNQQQSTKLRQNAAKMTNEKRQKEKIKLQLAFQLKKQQQLEDELLKKSQDRKKDIQEETQHKIEFIKQLIQKTNQDLCLELSNRILGTKRQNQKVLSNLKYEYSLLNSRTQQLEKVLKSMKNPTKDIIMMEEKLRKLGR